MSLPWRKILFHSRLLSPRGILTRAGIILLVFAALHLGGARDFTSIFSGTAPLGGVPGVGERLVGVLYLFFYLIAVVGVPILILTALILWALVVLQDRRAKGPPPP
ncbi:MAG: hypothetical protein KAI47_09075 [Deltaproteobacteria bacterium]|nr:hypothetical protein [Deltaproteobacteria bacterium]